MPEPVPRSPLSVVNHDRDVEGYRYVYPVVSRRAQGVSVGINLNPNNACNFRCVYCQVPGLVSGKGPEIDLGLLAEELRDMLTKLLQGDFMATRVPPESRRFHDLALSGNGEPTSSPQFVEVIQLLAQMRAEFGVNDTVKTVLITNGTLCHQPRVLQGVRELAKIAGNVWFKVDSATQEGLWAVNSTRLSLAEQRSKLVTVCGACPTWLQTCLFAREGHPPSETEQAQYLQFVKELVDQGVGLQGVLLYGLARPSLQPEAVELSALPADWMHAFAERLRQTGVSVQVSA